MARLIQKQMRCFKHGYKPHASHQTERSCLTTGNSPSPMANERFANFKKSENGGCCDSRDFYVSLHSMCDLKALQETEILKHFASDLLHQSSPNSIRRARTLIKLAPKIETENKKYIKERMYRRLAMEAQNAVFGKPHNNGGLATTGDEDTKAS